MNRTSAIGLACLLVLCSASQVLPQEPCFLFERLEKSVKQTAGPWKLKNRLVSLNKKYGSHRWQSGKSFVNTLIFVHDTPEQASRTYHNFDLEAFGLKRKVLGAVPDLADENYLWEDANDSAISGIDFRRGRVFVHITTSSMDITKQFAFLIEEDIDKCLPHPPSGP